MANGTDSEEFVLLSWVWMGHKRKFAFAVKAQSEIYRSLGWTLATLRYRESEGEKKTLRHTGDSYGRPSPSSFEFFRFVLLSLSVFCCFDLVLKLSCDFGISFPYFHEFTEYSRSVLRVKALTLNAHVRDSRVLS